MAEPTTLKTFPKLELAAILMYLMVLPKVRRPATYHKGRPGVHTAAGPYSPRG